MPIVLVSRDLMLASKLEGAARAAGETLQVVASGGSAIEKLIDCCLVVVDLEVSGLDIIELIEEVQKREKIPVIAYAPHVRTEKLTAAREAGCDQVISRGQLMSDAEGILRGFL